MSRSMSSQELGIRNPDVRMSTFDVPGFEFTPEEKAGQEMGSDEDVDILLGERLSVAERLEDFTDDVKDAVERVTTVLKKVVDTAAVAPVYTQNRTILVCVLYIIAAACEYWVVNWLKQFDVNLPVFFFLIQNGSWPIQYLLYKIEVKKQFDLTGIPRVITHEMYKSYLVLGGLASIIGLTRMYGLSSLPPTLYVICANTEIVFETIMTKVILKKDVTNVQIAAVCLVITGVVVSLYNPISNTYGGSQGSISSSEIGLGVALSLISRFCSSLNTILAEKLLGKDVKSKVGVNECAVANAVIPFFFTPICFSWTNEYKYWGSTLTKSSVYAQAVVVLLLITLSLSKQVDRLCKFAIVGATSTIFFAGVDAFMKMIAGVGSFLFFNALITWANVLGLLLITFAVAMMFWEKYRSTASTVPKPEPTRLSRASRASRASRLSRKSRVSKVSVNSVNTPISSLQRLK